LPSQLAQPAGLRLARKRRNVEPSLRVLCDPPKPLEVSTPLKTAPHTLRRKPQAFGDLAQGPPR